MFIIKIKWFYRITYDKIILNINLCYMEGIYMYKRKFFATIVILVLGIVLFSCVNSSEFTICFEVNGGSEVECITADHDSILDLPDDPIKEGFSFVGWFYDNETFETPLTINSIDDGYSKLTVYAKWELISHTITYELEGGINNINNPTSYVANGDTIIFLDPFKEDYVFLGWYDSQDVNALKITSFDTMSTDDITLYAKYISYTYETILIEPTMFTDGYYVEYGSTGTEKIVSTIEPIGGDKGSILYEGSYGQIYWALFDTGLLEITGIGDIPDASLITDIPWYEYKDMILYVYVSEGITRLGDHLFREEINLLEVRLPSSLESIGQSVFCFDPSLIKLVIPDNVKSIDNATFRSLYGLEYLHLPYHLETMYGQSIADIPLIEHLYLGPDVKRIDPMSFLMLDSLIDITVDIKNENYESIDGILYDEQITQLVFVPSEQGETSIIIPESVTIICNRAFYDANQIQEITIPKNMSEIMEYNFYNMPNLNTITYLGLENEWLDIHIYVGNGDLYKAEVIDINQNEFSIAMLALDWSERQFDSIINYLDEFYFINHPNAAFEITYGSSLDIQALKYLADLITIGATTDQEKVQLIFDWVRDNVSYEKEASSFSIDVYRTRTANCFGYSNLLNDLLRLSYVPSAVVTGTIAYPKDTLLQNIYTYEEGGHAWVMVYYDGEWHLMDATWNIFNPELEEIYDFYFPWRAENIVVYYEGMYEDLYDGPQVIYMNGNYYSFYNGEIEELLLGSRTCEHNNIRETWIFSNGYAYLDSEKIHEAYTTFTSGYITSNGGYAYVTDNGMQLNHSIREIEGRLWYFSIHLFEIVGAKREYSTVNGNLALYPGEGIQVSPDNDLNIESVDLLHGNTLGIAFNNKGYFEAILPGTYTFSIHYEDGNELFILSVINSENDYDALLISSDEILNTAFYSTIWTDSPFGEND